MVGIALVVCVIIGIGLPLAMIVYFMVPIMYRRRCRALAAARESFGLIVAEPGPVILFFLFQIVLALAIAFATCFLVCVTCCVAALPYIGTVILLPIHVFWVSYLLLFVRQFGPEYDVWSGLAPGGARGTTGAGNSSSSDGTAGVALTRTLPERGRGPEFLEGGGPTAIDHALAGALTHLRAQSWILHQFPDALREGIRVVRFGDEAVHALLDQFGGAAQIGNDGGQTAGLRFEDDVAEGVGRAGEHEDIG